MVIQIMFLNSNPFVWSVWAERRPRKAVLQPSLRRDLHREGPGRVARSRLVKYGRAIC